MYSVVFSWINISHFSYMLRKGLCYNDNNKPSFPQCSLDTWGHCNWSLFYGATIGRAPIFGRKIDDETDTSVSVECGWNRYNIYLFEYRYVLFIEQTRTHTHTHTHTYIYIYMINDFSTLGMIRENQSYEEACMVWHHAHSGNK